MRTNVTKLELEMKFVPARDNDPERKALTIYIQNDKMEHQISPMLHGTKAIDLLIAMCKGEIPWHDKVSFDDVGYQIRVDRNGLEVWHRVGWRADIHFFTFPMVLLADKLAGMYVSETQESTSYRFGDEELASIRKSWWPVARLVFDSEEAAERFRDCLLRLPYSVPDGFTKENSMELTREIQGLMRIARNYSSGEPTVVHIQTDFYPNSFYWYILTHDGYRVSNGGIIAHKYEDDDGNVTFKYSCHT